MSHKREIWVHEMQSMSGEYAPIGLGTSDAHDSTSKGVAAGYKNKADARAVGRIISWGRVRHRLVKYIPAPTTGKAGA